MRIGFVQQSSNADMNTSEVAITYVGGPTCVVEIGGVRFLTDPTFDPAGGGYTTGTVTLKKLRGPGLSEEEVGRFDYVLLTHDHTSTTLIVQAGRFCRRRKRCSQLAKARSGSSIDVQAP